VYLENGVNVEYFASGDAAKFREVYNLGDEKIILNVASFNPQKNQSMLIESFEKVLQKFPQSKLVLIGTVYDQTYYEDLIANSEKIKDSVIFIPNLPFDSEILINAYAACDLFVLPSLYEPFGIVVLEAWAALKPIACSGTGGLKFFVNHGKNGLIFSPKSSDDAADKIIKILEDKKLAAELARNGKISAEKHSWQNITRKLIEIYEAVS
jgi:glycosyltransferase involved in cell wall biosynthesis